MIPNTCSQAAAISCLIRTSSGFRSISPRSRLSPRAPRKPLLIRVVREHVGAEVADERHRRAAAASPPVTSTVMPGASASAAAIQEAVRDDDELALGAAARARGSTRSCSSRARRPRRPRRAPRPPARSRCLRSASSRRRSVEARPRTCPRWSGRTPPRTRATSPCRASSREVAADRDLRDGERFRKFRNLKRNRATRAGASTRLHTLVLPWIVDSRAIAAPFRADRCDARDHTIRSPRVVKRSPLAFETR